MIKGLRISVLEDGAAYDRKPYSAITLVGEGIGDDTPCADAPAFRRVTRYRSGIELQHLEPVEDSRELVFGGRFAFETDSRFIGLSLYPLPLFDHALE